MFTTTRRSRLPPRHAWSGWWQGAAVLLPLLLLAGLGVRGIQVSREDALQTAKREAARALEVIAPALTPAWAELREHALQLRVYPDPPIPALLDDASNTAAQALYTRAVKLADTDPVGAQAQLERLMQSPDALAPSGLPLLPLVCWQRVRLETDSARLPARLVELADSTLITHPSVLTPDLLTSALAVAAERGVDPGPWAGWRIRWKTEETLRAAWRQRTRQTAAGGNAPVWLPDGFGERWFLLPGEKPVSPGAPKPNTLRLLSMRKISDATLRISAHLRPLLPDDTDASFSLGSFSLSQPPFFGAEGGTLAAKDLGSGLSVRIVLPIPGSLYARQRQQTLWLAALLASALAASLAGFWTMRRALTRERQLGELKSNFVASVSHELRAPLAAVRLMAENLETGAVPAEARRREYHGLIAEECRRLSALIDNVLDFARIEQNRRVYDFAETDVQALVADATQLLQPRAAQRRQTIRVDAPPVDPPPLCDGLAVRQALINLLDNAVKFSPAGTTIHVRVGLRDAGAWQISVRDEGPGIPPAEHAAIFERFHRLGSELRRETQGAGIGLSIVRHIAQAHGGRVEVHSQPGEGSTFTLILPRLPTSVTE